MERAEAHAIRAASEHAEAVTQPTKWHPSLAAKWHSGSGFRFPFYRARSGRRLPSGSSGTGLEPQRPHHAQPFLGEEAVVPPVVGGLALDLPLRARRALGQILVRSEVECLAEDRQYREAPGARAGEVPYGGVPQVRGRDGLQAGLLRAPGGLVRRRLLLRGRLRDR